MNSSLCALCGRNFFSKVTELSPSTHCLTKQGKGRNQPFLIPAWKEYGLWCRIYQFGPIRPVSWLARCISTIFEADIMAITQQILRDLDEGGMAEGFAAYRKEVPAKTKPIFKFLIFKEEIR